MSLKELQAKIQWAGQEAWLEGNVDALKEAYAEDYVSHRPPFPDVEGLEAVKQSIAATRLAYSDIEATHDEWIAEGDAIAYRYTMRMKHTGTSPSLPIPPTGKEVVLQGCIVVHVRDGKVTEEWEYSDYLGFLQQLGGVPPLG
jgi:predicted ester cyclase